MHFLLKLLYILWKELIKYNILDCAIERYRNMNGF